MQYQRRSTSLISNRFQGVLNGFLAGLILGMLIGWFFHGFVGLVVRFGFVLILLVPLALVIWFFFLRSRAGTGAPDQDGGMQVFTWNSREGSRRYTADPRRQPADAEPDRRRVQVDEDVIDSEFRELKRQADRDE